MQKPQYFVRCLKNHASCLERDQMVERFGEAVVEEIETAEPITLEDIEAGRIAGLPVLSTRDCFDCILSAELADRQPRLAVIL